MTPDYLAIGHIAKDLRPDGSSVAGGTALYATLTAQRLGQSAAMVTALAPADGWMRAWRADGAVYPIPWRQAGLLVPACHVLVMSQEDTGGDEALLASYVEL